MKKISSTFGHPVKNKKLGIEFSNGSLGMGLINWNRTCYILKKKNKNNVYVIFGDGECNEGSVWEAAMSTPKFKLDNLNVIIDKNNFQQTGSKRNNGSWKFSEKWKSFGWDVSEIDGHNFEKLV